jgi:hypothetical protein
MMPSVRIFGRRVDLLDTVFVIVGVVCGVLFIGSTAIFATLVMGFFTTSDEGFVGSVTSWIPTVGFGILSLAMGAMTWVCLGEPLFRRRRGGASTKQRGVSPRVAAWWDREEEP